MNFSFDQKECTYCFVVRKVADCGPLRLCAKTTVNYPQKTIVPKVSVRDNVLDGKFSIDASRRALQYKKKVLPPIPIQGFGLIFTAQWLLTSSFSPKPTIQVSLSTQNAGKVLSNPTFLFRPNIPLKSNIHLKVPTEVSVQIPQDVVLFQGQKLKANEVGQGFDWSKLSFNVAFKRVAFIFDL